MRTIPLRGKKAAGRVALVDDEDYEMLMAYKWYFADRSRLRGGPYAQAGVRRPDGRWTITRMHKLLTGWPQTDHVNGDGLDNQRSNLRSATHAQNAANQRPVKGCSSPYKGVSWGRSERKWKAKIRVGGRLRSLGCFHDEKDAARAYDAAALAAWGEYACLNFPS